MDTFYVKYTIYCPLKNKCNNNKKKKKKKNGWREKAWSLESYAVGPLTLHTNVKFLKKILIRAIDKK